MDPAPPPFIWGGRSWSRPRQGSLLEQRREAALESRLRAAWSTPLKSSSGKAARIARVYRREPGLPTYRESEIIAHAAQLARNRHSTPLAEKALRDSEASFAPV